MTPGMTSGANIKMDRACLPKKRQRSMRNALQVPISTDSSVTQNATMQLVPMLRNKSPSPNSPIRPSGALPENQSSVKPRQGGAG